MESDDVFFSPLGKMRPKNCPSVCPSGVLDDHLKVKVVKDKLRSKPCRNQGFVLDGFPETCEQARELFYCEAPHPHCDLDDPVAEARVSSEAGHHWAVQFPT